MSCESLDEYLAYSLNVYAYRKNYSIKLNVAIFFKFARPNATNVTEFAAIGKSKTT